jgi:Na+-transporting NADH:ubiquinone oxidoreductase subunit B
VKALRNLLEKIKPNFEKGGKLEKFYPAYDAFETFLFVPGHTAPPNGAHVRDAIDLKRTMIIVVVSMIPCLLFGMGNVGYQHYRALGITDASLMIILFSELLKYCPLLLYLMQ